MNSWRDRVCNLQRRRIKYERHVRRSWRYWRWSEIKRVRWRSLRSLLWVWRFLQTLTRPRGPSWGVHQCDGGVKVAAFLWQWRIRADKRRMEGPNTSAGHSLPFNAWHFYPPYGRLRSSGPVCIWTIHINNSNHALLLCVPVHLNQTAVGLFWLG